MKYARTIVLFFAGVLLGATLLFAVILIGFYLDADRAQLRTRKTFCNLDLLPRREDGESSLVVRLDSKPFLCIFSKDGKVKRLAMLDTAKNLGHSDPTVLTVETGDVPGRWQHLYYGKKLEGEQTYQTGIIYEDIDCDGSFDRKNIWDDKGQRIERSFIYFRGDWLQVRLVDSRKGVAQSRDRSFVFVSYLGWQQDKGRDGADPNSTSTQTQRLGELKMSGTFLESNKGQAPFLVQ